MSPRIENLIIALVLAFLCGIWTFGYIVPKSDTLDAAQACMRAQNLSQDATDASREAWPECLAQAEKDHATSLLLVMGY